MSEIEKDNEELEEKEGHKKKHHFLNFLIFIVVLLVGCVFYSKYVGIKGLIVKEYRVESSILTENFSGIKIVHFSDLLYKSTVDSEDIKNLVNKINELRPDIVVFTGDLVIKGAKISSKDKEMLINELSSIKASIGKYAINGDNDYSYSDYNEVMNRSDFKVLNNQYEEVFYKTNESLYIVGLPCSFKDKINLDEAFKFYSDENRHYIIVLAHDGKTLKYLDESTYEVDLVLLGHSLNGSVVIPFYGGLFVDENSYKYYGEHYEKGITNIYVSSGLGTLKYKYRFMNKPSFNLYRLKAQS